MDVASGGRGSSPPSLQQTDAKQADGHVGGFGHHGQQYDAAVGIEAGDLADGVDAGGLRQIVAIRQACDKVVEVDRLAVDPECGCEVVVGLGVSDDPAVVIDGLCPTTGVSVRGGEGRGHAVDEGEGDSRVWSVAHFCSLARRVDRGPNDDI